MLIPRPIADSYRCAIKDRCRYQIHGVHFKTDLQTETVEAIATDGKTLIRSTFPLETTEDIETDLEITVGSQDMKKAIKISDGEPIGISVDEDKTVEQTPEGLPDVRFAQYTLRPGLNGSRVTGEGQGMFPDYKAVMPTTTPQFTWHLNPYVLKELCSALIKTAGLTRENSTVLFEYHQPDRPMVMSVRNSAGGETQALIMPLVLS